MWSQKLQDRAMLSWLLAPHSIEEFVADYYERAPLHIDRLGDDAHYAEFFSLSELDRVVLSGRLTVTELRLVKDGAPLRGDLYVKPRSRKKFDEKLPASDIIVADKVTSLFSAGATVVIDGVDRYSPSLARLCRGLEMAMRHRISPNTYLTPPSSRGFSAHYDTHDTIILQICGSKRWVVYGAPVTLPLDDQLFDAKIHDKGDPLFEVDMRAGDLLYLPRGFVHEARSNEELSLHVTLGVHPNRALQVLEEAIREAALHDTALRCSSIGDLSDDACERILATVSAADLRGAAARLDERFARERSNAADGQFQQIAAVSALSESSIVALRPNLLYTIEENEIGSKVHFSNKTLTFGKNAPALIDRISLSGGIEVGRLLEYDKNALSIVRKLIQESFAMQLISTQGLSVASEVTA